VIVAIHQPNFFPWSGYFHKILRADCFVFLDNVQYSKNSFINRNKIKTPKGPAWLTVPVATANHFQQNICETSMSWQTDWRAKHLATLHSCYGRAPHGKQGIAMVEREYADLQPETTLAELNIRLVRGACAMLDLPLRSVRSSELADLPPGVSTERLVNICRALGATEYLAGMGAPKYQEDALFEQAGIRVAYSQYKPPSYDQLWGAYTPNLSILDVLMNCGPAAKALLQ